MKICPDVTLTDTGQGLVLLNERTGRYWSLNGTGRAVLLMLADGATPEEAVDSLTRQHPDFADRITSDVEALIKSLLAEKVLLP
ncbi:lasso peptide biosynthesis PqqD family chaperone [Actinomadura terrae]|uniref:lasso peptide biosynthesis PqqD family chaperone n=1 Tax=Actinomadura terrae TaxID=604353 RepID=UPI001FA6E63A|nr:lasso peptide biosynthesis PqqD family chaperone [Actinomadura terrae]